MTLNEESETRGIRVMLVIEILGKPPEHLKETLEKISQEFDSEKGVEIKSKKIGNKKILF